MNVDILYYFYRIDWWSSFHKSFIIKGRQDILTTTIGIEEHLGRVWTAGFSVVVRQYFGLAPRSSSSQNAKGSIKTSIKRFKITNKR